MSSSFDLDASTDLISRGIQHPNPLFDFLTTFAPRKLKNLFTLCEYLYFNSPQIFAALNKFAIYPITEFTYNTDNSALKEKYKRLFEKTLKMKGRLITSGIDYQLYGNAFVSIYFPFRRFLKCPDCGGKENIRFVKYKFKLKGLQFNYKCGHCGNQVTGKVDDQNIRYAKGINIIRWDPKTIDIESNPITGEVEYYYNIPDDIVQRVRKGDRHLLDTMPYAFLETIAARKTFKFASDQIFHLKKEAPAGVNVAWGYPPLASLVKQFFYVAVLRKSNEAIALEHIVPFRVMHPQQSTTAADPTITISLSNWVSETKMNYKAWRRDPLHLMFAPIPVGVTNVGGQGRALMVTGEIKEAEESIIVGMGIPREFLYGGLTATGSPVTLRMLENQLLNYTSQLLDLAQWISDKCGRYMGWENVEVDMEDFKLIDDVQQKMALMAANAEQGGTLLAPSSIARMYDRDLKKERELRIQDELDEVDAQVDLEQRMMAKQQSLAAQAQSAAIAGQPMQYDQQAVIAAADEMVYGQLLQLDHTQRRSFLDQLANEDFVMYSVVLKRLELAQEQQQQAMAEQMPPQGM